MDRGLLSNRLPIRKVFKSELSAMAESSEIITKKFDMYRVMSSGHVSDAVKFAFFEYLLRVGISKEEYTKHLGQLPDSVRNKIEETHSMRASHNPFFALETLIEAGDLVAAPHPHVVTQLYSFNRDSIHYEKIVPKYLGPMPIFNIFTLSGKQILLYTPMMSFLDGYDPQTGEERNPILSKVIITKAKNTLVAYTPPSEKSKEIKYRTTQNQPSEKSKEIKYRTTQNQPSEKSKEIKYRTTQNQTPPPQEIIQQQPKQRHLEVQPSPESKPRIQRKGPAILLSPVPSPVPSPEPSENTLSNSQLKLPLLQERSSEEQPGSARYLPRRRSIQELRKSRNNYCGEHCTLL